MPLIDRRVAASLAACVLFLGPFVLAQRALAQQGAAYWKFDEGSGNVAHDSSGNHNDGTIVKAAWAEGASGKALAFRDYAAGYPSKPASESEYVLVKHSPGLTPHKSFEVSATIDVDPGFEPSFAAGIVQKGSGYGCSFRVLLRSDLHIQATVGQEHNSVVSQSAGCAWQMDHDSCDLRRKPGANIHRRQAGWFTPGVWSETRERGRHYHRYQIFRQNR